MKPGWQFVPLLFVGVFVYVYIRKMQNFCLLPLHSIRKGREEETREMWFKPTAERKTLLFWLFGGKNKLFLLKGIGMRFNQLKVHAADWTETNLH